MGRRRRHAATAHLTARVDELRERGFDVLAVGTSVMLCRDMTITTIEAANDTAFLTSSGTVTITTHSYNRNGSLKQRTVEREDVVRRFSHTTVTRRFDWTTSYRYTEGAVTEVTKIYRIDDQEPSAFR